MVSSSCDCTSNLYCFKSMNKNLRDLDKTVFDFENILYNINGSVSNIIQSDDANVNFRTGLKRKYDEESLERKLLYRNYYLRQFDVEEDTIGYLNKTIFTKEKVESIQQPLFLETPCKRLCVSKSIPSYKYGNSTWRKYAADNNDLGQVRGLLSTNTASRSAYSLFCVLCHFIHQQKNCSKRKQKHVINSNKFAVNDGNKDDAPDDSFGEIQVGGGYNQLSQQRAVLTTYAAGVVESFVQIMLVGFTEPLVKKILYPLQCRKEPLLNLTKELYFKWRSQKLRLSLGNASSGEELYEISRIDHALSGGGNGNESDAPLMCVYDQLSFETAYNMAAAIRDMQWLSDKDQNQNARKEGGSKRNVSSASSTPEVIRYSWEHILIGLRSVIYHPHQSLFEPSGARPNPPSAIFSSYMTMIPKKDRDALYERIENRLKAKYKTS